ncbi:SH3 domain-containing protein [Massilia sp. TS11]|uniref:SH3 domain-containing protein n=1 Tax=Massilia sp. TS11 TaxID=2908003 RepID=UPI001EDB260F|nr:SH3 domain-containing protein [Massilia sp. TS11]MCG2584528.1 SH3 domain-containing protein [Massilia sp. TS11]
MLWLAAPALALLLAGLFTPRAWWRRPTLANLALLGGLSLLIAGLWTAWPRAPAARPAPALAAAATAPAATPPARLRALRVERALNLRAAPQVEAVRLAVLPPGSEVRLSGARQGDWRELEAEVDGQTLRGWSSSLWLRRAEELAR